MTADVLLSRLDRVRRTGRGRWTARCPAHNDRGPSLSIRELDDGRTLLHCFAGCDAGAIVVALGMELSDLFPARGSDDKRRARERLPFSAIDALRLVGHEVDEAALLIAVTSRTPEQLTAERRGRLMRHAATIRDALRACGLRELAR
jgi:hypothetical protein